MDTALSERWRPIFGQTGWAFRRRKSRCKPHPRGDEYRKQRQNKRHARKDKWQSQGRRFRHG